MDRDKSMKNNKYFFYPEFLRAKERERRADRTMRNVTLIYVLAVAFVVEIVAIAILINNICSCG